MPVIPPRPPKRPIQGSGTRRAPVPLFAASPPPERGPRPALSAVVAGPPGRRGDRRPRLRAMMCPQRSFWRVSYIASGDRRRRLFHVLGGRPMAWRNPSGAGAYGPTGTRLRGRSLPRRSTGEASHGDHAEEGHQGRVALGVEARGPWLAWPTPAFSGRGRRSAPARERPESDRARGGAPAPRRARTARAGAGGVSRAAALGRCRATTGIRGGGPPARRPRGGEPRSGPSNVLCSAQHLIHISPRSQRREGRKCASRLVIRDPSGCS